MSRSARPQYPVSDRIEFIQTKIARGQKLGRKQVDRLNHHLLLVAEHEAQATLEMYRPPPIFVPGDAFKPHVVYTPRHDEVARESERFWRSASAADCCACVPISAFAAVSTAFVLRTAERAPGYSVRLTNVAHASAWSVAWLQSKSLASGAAALSCVSVTKWGQIWEMWEGCGRDVGRDPNAPASA